MINTYVNQQENKYAHAVLCGRQIPLTSLLYFNIDWNIEQGKVYSNTFRI